MSEHGKQTIVWRRVDLPGHEIAELRAMPESWELGGTVILTYQDWPCLLRYRVVCDAKWHTVQAEVEGRVGERPIRVQVRVDDERRWFCNGVECSAVAGSIDIDLGFTPSTNLLPIRRLKLDVGAEVSLRAAWLPFPALNLEPLQQTYRRASDRTYDYVSAGGAFRRTLTVNAEGLVTSYPGIWEAESVQQGPPAPPAAIAEG